MSKLVCIVCPRGCTLQVEPEGDTFRVTGNSCKRGMEAINAVTLDRPVDMGGVILGNVLGLGVDVVAASSLLRQADG